MTEERREPGPPGGAGPTEPNGTAPSGGEAAAAGQTAADPWAPFDTVLQEFAAGRSVAAGTFWGDKPEAVQGRFLGWANSVGWRCTLQLVRAPEENVVLLVAQGPPLPCGRPRMMVLGAFPPGFEPDTLRAALEIGYSIGETWGPAEEPPAGPEPAPDTPGSPT